MADIDQDNSSIDELCDTLLAIEHTERCSRLIGAAINSAFADDASFRETMRPLNYAAARKSKAHSATCDFYYEDALNGYLVSAYHSARAAELLFEQAYEYRGNLQVFGQLISVHHAFGPSIVFKLQSAQSLLSHDVVCQSLSCDRAAVEGMFHNLFPQLREARNALAHADERALGLNRRKHFSSGNDFETRQSYGQRGTHIFDLLDGDLKPIEIDVSSAKIVALIEALKGLLCVS